MPKTLQGIYENGIIKPLEKPLNSISKSRVVITFVDWRKNKFEGNSEEVLDILEKYRGILAKDFTKESSADYVGKIRKETDKEWEQRLSGLGIK